MENLRAVKVLGDLQQGNSINRPNAEEQAFMQAHYRATARMLKNCREARVLACVHGGDTQAILTQKGKLWFLRTLRRLVAGGIHISFCVRTFPEIP